MSTAQLTTPGREIEISEPSGVVKRRKVTSNALDKAAKELGLITVNARRMQHFGVVGRFLDQVGIIDYGNGRLVGSAEALADGIKRCATLVEKEGMNEELKATFLDLQLRFIRAMDANVQQMVELSGVTQANKNVPQAMPAKPFLVGAQVSPIQVNISLPQATAAPEIKEVK